MWYSAEEKAAETAELLADLHPLSRQIGSPEGSACLGAFSAQLQVGALDSVGAVQAFLGRMQDRHLFPLELPAILQGWQHASRHEVRELIQLDRELARHPMPEDFRQASRAVGRRQLRRLRPLRDSRLIQRYMEAVDLGHASGWHTLVYGIVLATFSFPLRQGLLHYAQQTQLGFLWAATQPLMLPPHERSALEAAVVAGLHKDVEQWFESRHPRGLTVV
jgi:urease accessory protein UreF